MEQKNSAPARARWKLLRSYLAPKLESKSEQSKTQGKLQKTLLGLLQIEIVSNQESVKENGGQDAADNNHFVFKRYRWNGGIGDENDRTKSKFEIEIRERYVDSQSFLKDHKITQESGVDNTGNVGLWPAEEIMAHFCLSNPDLFRFEENHFYHF